ncbi:Ribokinase [hydrothermal vent metagenome]|uniref:Ribokinase n=1 Tax=hydrothermal vent metagenome TaxID=652676 RepID=A0A3B0UYX8_9ZZZZ
MARRSKQNIKAAGRAVAGLGQCSLDNIALTDGFPQEDSKPEASVLLTQGGGPVATALVTLARLGVKTSFMGIVGDDDAGRAIKKELKAEGVSTAGLVTRKDSSSQRAFIIVNTKTASRTVIWQRASGAPLAPAEIRPALIKTAKLLLLDGLMEDASLAAAELAGSFNVPTLLDAGSMRPGMIELIKISDYVVASEKFASALSDTPKKALKELRAIAPQAKALTVTLGKNGSITCAAGSLIARGAFKVEATDSTGAGDVFHGGFAYGILKGWPIDKTIEFASAAAALKCRKAGGRTGIPTPAQTQRLIKEQAI